MQAITYSHFGAPDVLHGADLEPARPRSGELSIRVHAVSVNPLDGKIRRGELTLLSGAHFPKIPGCDLAGVVEEVGAGVAGFLPGDRVFGSPGNMRKGTLAEVVCVKAAAVSKLPESLDFVGAASIAVGGLAALQSLRAAKVTAGSRVLVNGATGGVGLLLLQLAKLEGAHVTAVASARGIALAREYGAHDVIDYQSAPIAASHATFDALFDLSTKLPFRAARQLLSARGTYVGFEPSPLTIISSVFLNLFRRQREIILVSKPSPSDLRELAERVRAGELRLPPTEVYQLGEAVRAFERAERGGVIGKIVISLPAASATTT